jgi:hypothetical protein
MDEQPASPARAKNLFLDLLPPFARPFTDMLFLRVTLRIMGATLSDFYLIVKNAIHQSIIFVNSPTPETLRLMLQRHGPNHRIKIEPPGA